MVNVELFAKTALVLAANRLRELILLFNPLIQLVADLANKCANLQLGLHLSCPRHCALNRHNPTDGCRLQISDLLNGRQVVDAYREPL